MAIRVLQVGKFFPPDSGGIETTTKDIAETNQDDIYQSDVLCFSTSRKTKIEYNASAKIIRCSTLFVIASMPFSFSYLYYFKKINKGYDIIHLHHPNPLGVLCLLLFRHKAKFLIHWHSDILHKGLFYKLFAPFEKALLKKADKIVGTSPVYINESPIIKQYNYKSTFIPSAHNGNALTANPARVNGIRQQYNNKKIVFTIGRHVGYKGFHFLIEAAKLLPNDTVVLIGGTGPLHNYHQNLITTLQLEQKVFLLGRVPHSDLGSYYKACDVFCLPSCHKSEAFGLVLTEAMSFAKPIVATNIPASGVSWVNQHGVTGLNAENENPASLAESILKLLADKNLLAEYGANAYERYLTYFTAEQMRKSFGNLYKNILLDK